MVFSRTKRSLTGFLSGRAVWQKGVHGGGGGGGAAAVGGSGAQLSSVRGRLNHYGTRRVLRMLGNYHNDI